MTTRTAPDQPRTSSWLLPFLVLALIWGASFLFIKVALTDLHPLYVALARISIGAVTLLVLLVATRDRLPSGLAVWGHLTVAALFLNSIPFTLFSYGERHVSSLVAGIWNATTPLSTLIVALAVLPTERPTRAKILGLVLGFVGVLTVLGFWRGLGGADLTGQLMCLAAASSYGVGVPYIRRFLIGRPVSGQASTPGRGTSGPALATGQLLVASLQLAVVAPIVAGTPTWPTHWSGQVLASVLALGALGTGIAFVLNYRVIRLAGATSASTVTYLIPVVSTTLGVMVLGEHLTWNQPVGAVVVLVAVAVSQGFFARLGRSAVSTPSAASSASVGG